jgi:hypothetical protein
MRRTGEKKKRRMSDRRKEMRGSMSYERGGAHWCMSTTRTYSHTNTNRNTCTHKSSERTLPGVCTVDVSLPRSSTRRGATPALSTAWMRSLGPSER